jgi:RNA polymerase sigma-70 factor (ECF subfamily)
VGPEASFVSAPKLNSSNLQALYCDHHGWLQGWLRKKVGDACDAADLAHDTFLRLLTRDEQVTLREPRAYLTTIAQGLLSNLHRHRKIEQVFLQTLRQLPPVLHPSPEERAVLLEALSEIDRRLDGLPQPVRKAFLLSQLDGLSQKEIARMLGVSLPSVQRYIARAVHQCYFSD